MSIGLRVVEFESAGATEFLEGGDSLRILASVKPDASRYLADRFAMVAVDSDLGLLARASDASIVSFSP